MPSLHVAEGLLLFAAYLISSLIMLGILTSLYIWITPYDEGQDIRAGKLAPAIALAGAMLGFTFPLLIASYARSGFEDFLAWSFVSCLVQLLVFRVLHALLPRVIETDNLAGATCFAAASVCAGLINAASFVLGESKGHGNLRSRSSVVTWRVLSCRSAWQVNTRKETCRRLTRCPHPA